MCSLCVPNIGLLAHWLATFPGSPGNSCYASRDMCGIQVTCSLCDHKSNSWLIDWQLSQAVQVIHVMQAEICVEFKWHVHSAYQISDSWLIDRQLSQTVQVIQVRQAGICVESPWCVHSAYQISDCWLIDWQFFQVVQVIRVKLAEIPVCVESQWCVDCAYLTKYQIAGSLTGNFPRQSS